MASKIERIRALRGMGKSLSEAKRIVEKHDIQREIAKAENVGDIKAILFSIVARL